MAESAYFLIEGGKALELVKGHIAERQRVRQGVRALADELGIQEGGTDRLNGVLSYAVFPIHVEAPADFKKRDRRGRSYPKKGTPWAAKFAAQVGHQSAESVIAVGLGVPTLLEWSAPNGDWGQRNMGIFDTCGFLYLGAEGPYVMWVPDLPKEVAALEVEVPGATVKEPAKSFKLEFEGCTRIEKERWEILVLQEQLKEKEAGRKAETEASAST